MDIIINEVINQCFGTAKMLCCSEWGGGGVPLYPCVSATNFFVNFLGNY